MAFNEKLEKKLKKILAKAGLEEDKIDEIVTEVEGELVEEGAPEESNPIENEPTEPSEEPKGEGEPTPKEEPAPQGEPTPAIEEEVPPTDGSIEAAINELVPPEQGATPPVDESVPQPAPQAPIPAIDPSEFQKAVDDLAEANKTIEGLTARVDSLEEALKAAGVITSDAKVGDETPRLTPNASRDSGEDALDNVLSVINGK